MPYRRPAAQQHEKSMRTYGHFAWGDACAIAAFLTENFPLGTARRTYQACQAPQLAAFNNEYASLIEEFLAKTEGQRGPYFRKITKNASDGQKIVFLVLAILALERVRKVLELRDEHRAALAPGQGNRATASALYAFVTECDKTQSFDWPSEPFDAIGEYSYDDGDDEDS